MAQVAENSVVVSFNEIKAEKEVLKKIKKKIEKQIQKKNVGAIIKLTDQMLDLEKSIDEKENEYYKHIEYLEKEKKKAKSKKALEAAFGKSFSDNHKKEKKAFKKKIKEQDEKKNIHDDFIAAANEIIKKIFYFASLDPVNAYMIKSTPGTGKTEAALELCSDFVKKLLKPMYAAPTREQAWQFGDRYKATLNAQGFYLVVLQGRHGGYIRKKTMPDGSVVDIVVPPNCYNMKEIERCREKCISPRNAVCAGCSCCPTHRSQSGVLTGWGNACPYFTDYGKAAGMIPVGNYKPVVVTTHQMAACIVTEGEMIVPDVLIMDEDFTSAMRETFEWNEDELQRVVFVSALAKGRRLMKQAIRVAKRFRGLSDLTSWDEKYKELSDEDKILWQVLNDSKVDPNTFTLKGVDLYLVLRKAAYEIGEDLDELLEQASLSGLGIHPGEMMNMSEQTFNQLPHQKEPELAFELQSVVNDAKQAKETAYKVSLRKTAGKPWGFHWDFVRRVNYGGKLIILDAYGEKKIYERVCNRDVDIADIKCMCRENVSVFHHDRATSRKFMDNEEYRLKLFYDLVVPVLKKSKGKKVLIYTQKRYAEWLKVMIARSGLNLKAVVIKWFWMDRGDNSFGDFDTGIIFGTPFSNVTGDMHLVNAMFAGEEPIDFSKLKNGEWADPRVAVVKKSRQENELLQALFRLRPSKPRTEPQEIHIISNMRLPLDEEMPGATIKKNYSPDFDNEGILLGMRKLQQHFGFYTPIMSAFIYEPNLLIDWYEAGGVASGKSLLMTYDELVMRVNVFGKYRFCKQGIKHYLEGGLNLPLRYMDLGAKKPTRVWGEKEKDAEICQFFELFRQEFREPGSDDGIPITAKTEAVDAEDQQQTDEQKVAEESKSNGTEKNKTALHMLEQMKKSSVLSEEEWNEKYGSYEKELGHTGTDTS